MHVPSIHRTNEREHSTSALTIRERNLFTSASCGETSTSGAERMAPTRKSGLPVPPAALVLLSSSRHVLSALVTIVCSATNICRSQCA